jgi:hypothetical protein
VSELVEKVFAIHDSLKAAGLPHAFGGAIALAYCVEEPRGTRDLDLNIFVDAGEAGRVLGALPWGVGVGLADIEAVKEKGEARLDWEGTPVDVFLNSSPLHDAVAASVIWVPLEDRQIPVLDCASLAIFKAFIDRTRHLADLEAIAEVAPEEIDAAARTITELVGADDPAAARLRGLTGG